LPSGGASYRIRWESELPTDQIAHALVAAKLQNGWRAEKLPFNTFS
jgi:hypothetical protein